MPTSNSIPPTGNGITVYRRIIRLPGARRTLSPPDKPARTTGRFWSGLRWFTASNNATKQYACVIAGVERPRCMVYTRLPAGALWLPGRYLFPFPFQNDNNYVGCIPCTNGNGAWNAPYDILILLALHRLINNQASSKHLMTAPASM